MNINTQRPAIEDLFDSPPTTHSAILDALRTRLKEHNNEVRVLLDGEQIRFAGVSTPGCDARKRLHVAGFVQGEGALNASDLATLLSCDAFILIRNRRHDEPRPNSCSEQTAIRFVEELALSGNENPTELRLSRTGNQQHYIVVV